MIPQNFVREIGPSEKHLDHPGIDAGNRLLISLVLERLFCYSAPHPH